MEYIRTCQPKAGSENQTKRSGTELEIIVPFTNVASTNTALEKVSKLALNLNVRIRVIAVRFVPFSLPIERPPVSMDFLQAALRSLSCSHPIEREIYLSRDSKQTWNAVLSPGSLVVITPPKHMWFSQEQKIARAMRRQGHQVCCITPK